MTFVEKQMACQLLARRDWTWPEIFAFLELVTQAPIEPDERRALQRGEDPPKHKKVFHDKQPIMLIAIADTVFDQVNSALLSPDFWASEDEYFKSRNQFRKDFEEYAEGLARRDSTFKKLVTIDPTKTRDLLHVECRSFLKEWWAESGIRI